MSQVFNWILRSGNVFCSLFSIMKDIGLDLEGKPLPEMTEEEKAAEEEKKKQKEKKEKKKAAKEAGEEVVKDWTPTIFFQGKEIRYVWLDWRIKIAFGLETHC